jgi:hypothetical protein
MELKQLSKWFVITGALVIGIIKIIIRPMQPGGEATRYFLNIAPNLLGAFLIPFCACWFFSGRNFLLARIFKIESSYDLRLVCLMGFCYLVVNEYFQLIPYFGRTFDYNDILFSSVGLVISCLVFGKMQSRSKENFETRRI